MEETIETLKNDIAKFKIEMKIQEYHLQIARMRVQISEAKMTVLNNEEGIVNTERLIKELQQQLGE